MSPPDLRNYKGKLLPTRGRVHVSVAISQSKSQEQRIGAVILAYDCRVTSTHMLRYGPRMGAELILKLPIEHLEEAMEELAPHSWEYESPTFFDRGQILPIYETAEDELDERPCQRYQDFCSRLDKEDWMTPKEREEYERARSEGMDCK